MSDNKLGIENVKAMIGLGIKFGQQIEVAMEDDKFTTSDAFGFLDELMAIPDVAKHSKETLAEALDLTAEERLAIDEWAQNKFDIKNDEIEEKVESAIDWALSNLMMYKVWSKKKPATGTK